MRDLNTKLQGFCVQKEEHSRYLKNVMKPYNNKDFTALGNHTIIKEVREFRLRIAESYAALGEVDKLFGDLNQILIMQDMNNALKLLNRKSSKLRQRL